MAFPGHEHTCTHAEPARANGRPRHTVQSCSAQAGRFLRGFPGRAAALRRPQLLQPCARRAWIGSTRPHPPRARRFFCRAASAPEGSGKIWATRRAQDRRSPLTVKRTRAGAPPTPQPRHRDPRSGLRGTRTAQRPAKVAHPLAPGVSGPSAWAASAAGPAPPRPAAAPALRMLMGRRKILFYFPRIMSRLTLPHPLGGYGVSGRSQQPIRYKFESTQYKKYHPQRVGGRLGQNFSCEV